jgi:hypothetical protein
MPSKPIGSAWPRSTLVRHLRGAKSHPIFSVCPATLAGSADEASYYKNAYTILDLPLSELLSDIPELQDLEPARSQQELAIILRKVGSTVEQLYRSLPSLVADERMTQEQCDDDGRTKSTTTTSDT